MVWCERVTEAERDGEEGGLMADEKSLIRACHPQQQELDRDCWCCVRDMHIPDLYRTHS